jgi:hypothetical protein
MPLKKLKSLAMGAPILLTIACGQTNGQPPAPNDLPKPPQEAAPQVPPFGGPDDPIFDGTITNDHALRRAVGLEAWLAAGHHGDPVTIGILDNGFGGLKNSVGKRLPAGLTVEPSPIQNESGTPHGRVLAEIITALTSGSPVWTPQSRTPNFKLYNANGFSNFAAAVDRAIKDQVRIILYSQVWEFGGNFDGRGFINHVVDKAVGAGIIWINAAGNYAESSWQGRLMVNPDQTASLPWSGRFIRMNVKEADTPVKISLAWNDFADTKNWRTYRDLDLVLLDAKGRVIDMANKIQDGRDHGNDPTYSAHARETLAVVLPAGDYLLRVDVKSRNFDGYARIRLAADGPGVTFIDKSPDASIMIPADNPNVITVGADDTRSSSRGRTLGGATKPDVLAPSFIQTDVGAAFEGSSTAAAVAAATLAVYEGACGRHSRADLARRIATGELAKFTAQGPILTLPERPVCY